MLPNQKRIERPKIVERNIQNAIRSSEFEPKYPKVREIWDGTKIITSFSHANLSPWSSQVVGNLILNEMIDALGLKSTEVIRSVHDYAIPHKDPDPGGHRLDIGANPKIFDGDKPYASNRHIFRRINFRELEEFTLNAFKSEDITIASERFADIVEILRSYEQGLVLTPGICTGRQEITNLSDSILSSRRQTFNLLGLDYLEEFSLSSIITKIADSLAILEYEYGLPFYKMNLSEEFAAAGYLKGIDRNGNRKPITIEIEGKDVKYTFIDSYTYSTNGSGSKRSIDTITNKRTFVGSQIYEAMKEGIVIPTVPTIVLATTTAPQIPHMGAFNWRDYAPRELRNQAAFLGLSREIADALYLCTEGYNAFGVRRSESIYFGSFSGYISLGKDEVQNILRKDEYIEVQWGEIYKSKRG